MNKAVFLDRDGVLLNNEQHYYIWKPDQLEFVDGVFDNLKMLEQKGFKLFIVSNQGGISRGWYTREDILKLHGELIQAFDIHHISIVDILFCPHHPDTEQCLCRKPQPLMINKLMARYGLCAKESYMIGDSESDMKAAESAGIKGIKIQANKNMFSFIANLVS